MNSATLPLLAIAARLAAERRINAKDRPPHSTKKIARVGAYPDRPHLRCVTRKPVGPQYGITLLAAEPAWCPTIRRRRYEPVQGRPTRRLVLPVGHWVAHHGGDSGGSPRYRRGGDKFSAERSPPARHVQDRQRHRPVRRHQRPRPLQGPRPADHPPHPQRMQPEADRRPDHHPGSRPGIRAVATPAGMAGPPSGGPATPVPGRADHRTTEQTLGRRLMVEPNRAALP